MEPSTDAQASQNVTRKLPPLPQEPLGKIALSCSGGGYRATAFHLGAIAYLNRLQYQGKPLLERVKLISTVSGGTITGVVYALQKQQGKSFNDIYSFLNKQLRTIDLVQEAINLMEPDASWEAVKPKRKNVINAMSRLYDEKFTMGGTMGDFDVMKCHLEAIVFNSTEFDNAINFRFRNKALGCGNHYIKVAPQVATEVKLGDVIAASSCFPAGFEPILWPSDFIHADGKELIKLNEKTALPTGLMDGGIYDNQGISSILEYCTRSPQPYFDLVIISDVASPCITPFKSGVESSKGGLNDVTIAKMKQKLVAVNSIMSIVLVGLFAALVLLPFIWGYQMNACTGFCLGLSVTFLLLFLIKQASISVGKGIFNFATTKMMAHIPEFFKHRLNTLNIEHFSWRRIKVLLADRVNSLVTLNLEVFLKVVRRLNYDKLYNNDLYHHRRIANLVKELTEHDFNEKAKRTGAESHRHCAELNGTYEQVVGDKIPEVAKVAAQFGTTLWFTEEAKLTDTLDCLLASGQFTMCYNMLDYLDKIIFGAAGEFALLNSKIQSELLATYEFCLGDWRRFKQNPKFLVEELC